MKYLRFRRILSLVCAVALLSALGACAADDTPYKSYNLDKLVKIGEYKGVEAKFTALTDEAAYAYVEEIFNYYQMPPGGIKDDPSKEAVAEGDLVLFDYEGTAEGATETDLKGMKGSAPLVIGSGGFIPGFEEQMVGQPRDKEFDVKVTFPDPYQNSATLAGKEAVFKCTVHAIGSDYAYTDEDVQELTGGEFATLAEFLELLKPEVEDDLARQNALAAFKAALDNAEFLKIPAKETKFWKKQLEQEAKANDISVEEYIQGGGYANAQALLDEQVKKELFAFAVAAKEDIAATEEDVKALLDGIRAETGQTGTDDELIEKYYYGSKSLLLRMLTTDKVSKFIYENAKNPPPAG